MGGRRDGCFGIELKAVIDCIPIEVDIVSILRLDSNVP
jgi:hypothetical protein